MFLMIGVKDGKDTLYYERPVYFSHLGRAVNVTVFVTFTQLLLFFIPTFKWNKHYYVQLPNGEVYELNANVGQQVARGRDVEIKESDLFTSSSANYYADGGFSGSIKDFFFGDGQNQARGSDVFNCPHCGYPIVDDFDFCPKCGKRLH
ncbi:MAG: zinc ribbon domain-containing protein [Clostridia bacterium]|nr:zinc ribbon domain-containing protein [Clostridia bacterium]